MTFRLVLATSLALVCATSGVVANTRHAHPIGSVCLPQVAYNPESNRAAWFDCIQDVLVNLSLCPSGGYRLMNNIEEPHPSAIARGDIEALAQWMTLVDVGASAIVCPRS